MFRFIHILIIIVLICPSSLSPRQNIDPSVKNQKIIAGHAIFPDKHYKEWLKVQSNPGIDPASKIKCTVNSFFICKYEAVVKGSLLDFGFLFNRKNDQAALYYSYELGLMYYILEAWKLNDNLWKFYEYRPKFDELIINGKDATIKIQPRNGKVHVQYPYSVTSGLSFPYSFNLREIDRIWLIQKTECEDEMHDGNPPGTDFISQLEKMKKNRHEYEKSLKAPQKDQKKIPSLEELKEARKIELYHEIFGYYKFVLNEKILLISFFIKDKHLFGHYESIPEIPIFPMNDNPLEFEWRPESPYDKIYKLRFIRDRTGNITKCLIQI